MRVLAAIGVVLLATKGLAVPLTTSTSEGYLDYSVLDTNSSSSELQADILAAAAATNQKLYQETTQASQWKICNSNNTVYRREWSAFSTSERKEYIDAVLCMQNLTSKTPKEKCPGCVNRYDDFVAAHINQTYTIHNTGNFFAWHRYFTWAYEQTLRNECGYSGYQPYYNWPLWAEDPAASPALDGSETSLGGNGIGGNRCTNQSYYGIPSNDDPIIKVPHGEGGGCVTSGPFKEWKVNVGGLYVQITCSADNPESNSTNGLAGLGFNPRCLKRDISSWVSSQWSTDERVTELLKSEDIRSFWYDMQDGEDAFANGMGVHSAGHFTIGGDPGSDFMASPGDPWFYFHHGQIDRTWWTWQNLNPETRTNAIYGTVYMNDTTAVNATLEDTMSLGYAYEGSVTVRETMSTMGGPFCYSYI